MVDFLLVLDRACFIRAEALDLAHIVDAEYFMGCCYCFVVLPDIYGFVSVFQLQGQIFVVFSLYFGLDIAISDALQTKVMMGSTIC